MTISTSSYRALENNHIGFGFYNNIVPKKVSTFTTPLLATWISLCWVVFMHSVFVLSDQRYGNSCQE